MSDSSDTSNRCVTIERAAVVGSDRADAGEGRPLHHHVPEGAPEILERGLVDRDFRSSRLRDAEEQPNTATVLICPARCRAP